MGANSILIEWARRFTLLVGNYSREGFNHPGPANALFMATATNYASVGSTGIYT